MRAIEVMMMTSLRVFLIILFIFIFSSLCEGKEAATYKCDVIKKVDAFSSHLIDIADFDIREDLSSYSYELGDPLILQENLSNLIIDQSGSFVSHVRSCDEGSEYISMLLDPDWRPRAVALALFQKINGQPINLTKAFVGYSLSILSERVVAPPAPKECAPVNPPASADYNASTKDVWYSWRAMLWVECADNSINVYFPESGWITASVDHVAAIRISNPVESED